MTKWIIKGADRETGEDRTVIVDAPADADARRQAGKMGLLIASIEPDAPADETVPTLAVPRPDYSGISFGASVIRGLAIFYLLAAIFLAVGWLLSSDTSPAENGSFSSLILGIKITSILGLVFVSAVLFMIAGVANAVRDIARNSFLPRHS